MDQPDLRGILNTLHAQRDQALAQAQQWQQASEAARRQVAAVRRVHAPVVADSGRFCNHCRDRLGRALSVAYPCATVMALNNEERRRRNADDSPGNG